MMKNQPGLDREYDETILVLQGGGSLGAYQAGALESLSRAGIEFDWIVGVSIGAINASIIAGNAPESRVDKLRSFWESVTADFPPAALAFSGASSESLYSSLSSLRCFTFGVPGFFLPRVEFPFDELIGDGDTSFYDTSPLRKLLEQHVDFDIINSGSVRFSLRSVNVKTGQVVCFDNRETRIGPDNVMASGALPPGFPPIKIGSDYYWDGGIVSNTPLSYVLDAARRPKSLIFEVDLFNSTGKEPRTINDVLERRKDIIYSSRTRTSVAHFKEIHELRRAIFLLRDVIPPEMASTPKISQLLSRGEQRIFTIVRLVYSGAAFEGAAKDCEFSRVSMQRHWAAGRAAADSALWSKQWRTPPNGASGVALFEHDERLNEFVLAEMD